MKQAYLQNLGMIVTEKCNLNCEHCMRGNKTCKSMSDDVVKATLDNIYGMDNLAICGGEPTMACNVIEKMFTTIVDEKKWIKNVSVVINGTIYSEDFLRLLEYINGYINKFSKDKNIIRLMISFDDYHANEIIRLNMTDLYLENLKKYQESKFFFGLKGINGKLFNEGDAKKLNPNITEQLRPMPIYYTYPNKENDYLAIGPLITVNPEGIITEANASIENQYTIYNYGNILTESLEEIVKRQGIITNPINWYSDCSKAIQEFKRYRKY
ncbi:MAG TPA: radical SAM protein [Candidatus Aphodocola excrementigallinarum]|uniref:Radical SAM protein n=1 Tax=Candidatus Aphodocola excrementigallinarum TaxID=2840670 RepID=A0A9D1IP22_9FIRM|nr:radical SAM protein [Candidatus Aphodocola excrementigallinarum]